MLQLQSMFSLGVGGQVGERAGCDVSRSAVKLLAVGRLATLGAQSELVVVPRAAQSGRGDLGGGGGGGDITLVDGDAGGAAAGAGCAGTELVSNGSRQK